MLSIQMVRAEEKVEYYWTVLHSLLNTNKMRQMEERECDRVKEWNREAKRRSEVKRFCFCLFVCLDQLWMEANKQQKANSLWTVMVLNLSRVLGLCPSLLCFHPFTLIFHFIYILYTLLGFLPFGWFVFPWTFIFKSNWSVTLISI